MIRCDLSHSVSMSQNADEKLVDSYQALERKAALYDKLCG